MNSLVQTIQEWVRAEPVRAAAAVQTLAGVIGAVALILAGERTAGVTVALAVLGVDGAAEWTRARVSPADPGA